MKAEGLAEARDVLFRSWIRHSYELRKPMVAALSETTKKMSPGKLLPDGTRLKPADARETLRVLNKHLGEAFKDADSSIRKRVDLAIKRAARAQEKYLESLGMSPSSPEAVERIKKSVLKEMTKEFPSGSGMRYIDRLRRIRREHTQQMKSVLTRSYSKGDALNKITRDMTQGLTNVRPGRTPLVGGSASKKLQRLLVGEETRLAQEVERRIAIEYGVVFGYWRLHPQHPNYGGGEVCEVLADSTGGGVFEKMRSLGINPAGVSDQGLYLVSDWPEYPHPYCKCYMEPVDLMGSKVRR